MIGTIKINLWIGFIAAFISLVMALSGNVLLVSVERAVYAFLLFFIAMFPVRLIVGLIKPQPSTTVETGSTTANTQAGSQIDLVTPENLSDEDRTTQAEVESDSDHEPSNEFTPLVPKRIEPTTSTQNPENNPLEIADVIRRLTDE
ncbi:hypothetical protein [Brevibacillus sp. SYSU BS000544]|uniref:hypothetical protein n=1 Tax=Brevibacillus sp. SYSU BS000544 TaxID=3416443 RepID=UPI003CE503F9